jgi:hypothetical protein
VRTGEQSRSAVKQNWKTEGEGNSFQLVLNQYRARFFLRQMTMIAGSLIVGPTSWSNHSIPILGFLKLF